MTKETAKVRRCEQCGAIVEEKWFGQMEYWFTDEDGHDFCSERCSDDWFDEHKGDEKDENI